MPRPSASHRTTACAVRVASSRYVRSPVLRGDDGGHDRVPQDAVAAFLEEKEIKDDVELHVARALRRQRFGRQRGVRLSRASSARTPPPRS